MNCSTWFMVSFFSPGLPPPFGPVWRFGLLLLSSRFFKVQTLSFLSSGQRDKMVNMLTYLFLKNRSTSRIICDTCALRRKPLQCERKDFCRLRQKKKKKENTTNMCTWKCELSAKHTYFDVLTKTCAKNASSVDLQADGRTKLTMEINMDSGRHDLALTNHIPIYFWLLIIPRPSRRFHPEKIQTASRTQPHFS